MSASRGEAALAPSEPSSRALAPGPCLADEALAAWAEGSASGEQVARMTAHLAECARCRVVLSELARVAGPRRRRRSIGRWLALAWRP